MSYEVTSILKVNSGGTRFFREGRSRGKMREKSVGVDFTSRLWWMVIIICVHIFNLVQYPMDSSPKMLVLGAIHDIVSFYYLFYIIILITV